MTSGKVLKGVGIAAGILVLLIVVGDIAFHLVIGHVAHQVLGNASLPHAAAQQQRVLQHADQRIRQKPNGSVAYIMRANTYASQGNYERALTNINQALKLEPQNTGYWYMKGLVCQMAGQQQKAITAYQQVVKWGPQGDHTAQNLVPRARARIQALTSPAPAATKK